MDPVNAGKDSEGREMIMEEVIWPRRKGDAAEGRGMRWRKGTRKGGRRGKKEVDGGKRGGKRKENQGRDEAQNEDMGDRWTGGKGGRRRKER